EIDRLIASTDEGIDEREYKKQTNHISILMSQGMRNRYLEEIMTNLRQKMFWYYCYLGTSTEARRQHSNALWRQLSDALATRAGAKAGDAAHEIMMASKRFALTLMDSEDQGAFHLRAGK